MNFRKGDWVELRRDIMGDETSLMGFRPVSEEEWVLWKSAHGRKKGAHSIRAGEEQPPRTKKLPVHIGVQYKVSKARCTMKSYDGFALMDQMCAILDPFSGHTIFIKRDYMIVCPVQALLQ